MVKGYTIQMIEHQAFNNPTVVASTDVINGYLFTITDGASVAPAANDAELYVALNDLYGDDRYVEGAIIPSGSMLNGYRLKDWEGEQLEVSGDNLATAIGSISVGDTLKADANGKFSKTGLNTGVTFTVTGKFSYGNKVGVRVKIVVA